MLMKKTSRRSVGDKVLGIFITLVILSLLMYAAHYVGLLWYIAVFFLGFGGVVLLVALSWILDCRNKSGCFSGVILAFPVLFIPLGAVMLLVDYLLT